MTSPQRKNRWFPSLRKDVFAASIHPQFKNRGFLEALNKNEKPKLEN